MIKSKNLGNIAVFVFVCYTFIVLTFSDLEYGKKLFIASGFLLMVLVALGFELFSKKRNNQKKRYILLLSSAVLLSYLIFFVSKLM